MKNDAQLQTDVEQSYAGPSVRARIAFVETTACRVDGQVITISKNGAADGRDAVSNARSVRSEIKVEMPSSAIRTDEDIARTAVNILSGITPCPVPSKVQVTALRDPKVLPNAISEGKRTCVLISEA